MTEILFSRGKVPLNIFKNKLVLKNSVTKAKYGSYPLRVMGSCRNTIASSLVGLISLMDRALGTVIAEVMVYFPVKPNVFMFTFVKSHNRTERESKGVGRDILISKKLFLELCGPRGNSFR